MTLHDSQSIVPERILIVIGHANRAPWSDIASQGQCETWIPEMLSNGFHIAYVYCDKFQKLASAIDRFDMRLRYELGPRWSSFRNKLNWMFAGLLCAYVPNVELKVSEFGPSTLKYLKFPFPDLYLSSRWKRLSVLAFFNLQNQYDYLIYTTSSSYLNWRSLLEEVSKLPKNSIGGRIMFPESITPFISGSFTVYNKSAAAALLINRKKMPVWLVDDLSFVQGQMYTQLKNYSISSIDIQNMKTLESLELAFLQDISHFRLKSERQGKREDVALMKELHSKIRS